MSPRARILTGWRRLARPASRRDSSVTSSFALKRASRSERLTGCVWVRNFSNGIDIFLFGPRSFRIRMWIGFWPPSYADLLLLPERRPAPLEPRPEVLPCPVPGPRPSRLRRRREPRAGCSVCRAPCSLRSSAILDPHQVIHLADHRLELGRVGVLRLLADAAELQRAKRRALDGGGAVGRSDLLESDLRQEVASSPPPASPPEPSESAAAAGATTSLEGSSAA